MARGDSLKAAEVRVAAQLKARRPQLVADIDQLEKAAQNDSLIGAPAIHARRVLENLDRAIAELERISKDDQDEE